MNPTVSISGGQKLRPRLQAMLERLQQRKQVKIGIPTGSGSTEDGELTMAQLAAIHEFGAGPIPERSFLRVPLRANAEFYVDILEHGLAQVLREELTIGQVYEQIGARAAADSQNAISQGIAPALKPATVRRKTVDGKKGTTPLIDEGRLLESIDYVVE